MKGRGTRKLGKNRRTTRKQKRRRSRRTRRGGLSLAQLLVNLPLGQDLVNAGRMITTGAKNVVRGYKGVHPAVSPLPTKGQFKSSLKFKNITPPNLRKIRAAAKRDVASFERSL